MESSDNERLEQIIRVDAHALLKTIRDLEYKISEHHRLEKSPPWAAALESRIDLLEKRYFAIADTKSSYGDERGAALNFEEMSHDERVISKVRTEMDSKIDTSRTMTESKLLSTNLEIDRIHKIIQLRPTTSDMQQVMLAVHEIEKKTLTSVDAFSAKIDSLVEEKFSAELSHILEQLEATRGITEHSSELMQKQMAEAAREMTQVQMAFQNSFEKVKSEIATTNNAADRVTAQIAAVDDKYKNVTDAMQEKHSELSKALESNLALINSNDAGAQKMFAALEKRMGEDHEQLYGELLSTISKMNTMQTEAKLLESNLSKLKMTYETDLQGLKTTITDSNSKLSQVQTKMKEMNAILHELMNYDYTGQLAKHSDSISKNTFDIMDLKNQVSTTIKEDIAAVTSATATMKEELGKVPQSFADVTQKIRDLRTTDRAIEEELHKLDERLIAADTTVTGLLPLKVRVVNLENTSILTDKEVESLRETLTSNIDESEELRGRVTELEDGMKDFDENIEGRMNMIRDTLMDTILEKQTETNDTMRNVRENLELMSMAGDPGSGGNGGGAGGTGSVMSKQKSIGSMRGGDPMAAGGFMGMGSALGGGSQAGSRGSAFIPGRGGGSLSSRQDLSGTTLRGAPPPAAGRQSTSMGSVASRQPSMRGSGGGGDGYGGDLSSASAGSVQSSHRGSVAMPARRGTLNRRSGGGGSIISGVGHISQPSLDSQESYMSGASSGSSGAGMNARGVPGARGSIMKPARTSLKVSTPSANTDHSVNEEDEDEYDGEDGEAAGQRIKRVQSTPLSPMSARGEVEADQSEEQGENGSRPSSVEAINSKSVGNSIARGGKSGGKSSHHVVSFSKLDSDDDDDLYRSRSPGGGNSPSAPVVILPPETSANAAQFADLMGDEGEYILYNQAQFISDLCINFEEISVKRKRIEGIPPVMCENIAAVTQELAEFIARTADSEMVQTMLLKAAAHSVATNMITAVFDEATYDESFVINRRQQKISEYVDYVTAFVAQNNPQPGIIRMDARTIFISALSKALDMFMSKHNQVLVVGNSRLGRIKIPSCIACDRPLVDKVRLENGGAGDVLHPRGALAAGSSAYGVGEEGFSMHDALDISTRGGRNATSPDKAVMLVNIQQNHIYNNGPSGTTDHGGDSSHYNQKRRKMAGAGGKMGMSQSTGTLKLPRAKMHKNSNHTFRPQTSAESMSEEVAQAYVMRGGFKMPRDRPSSVQFAGENGSGGHGNGNGQKQGFLPQMHQ